MFVAASLFSLMLGSGQEAAAQGLRCLPSCSTVDGRFLAISGSNLINLSESELNLSVSAPAGTTSFSLGFFDGDANSTDSGGVSHWDTSNAAVYEYSLFADPLGNGTGTTPAEFSPGVTVLLSTSMPDNAWIDYSIVNASAAETPSGNFFYRLNIRLTTPIATTTNAFKVRTSAVLSGVTLNPTLQPFSYIANLRGLADLQIIYPAYPSAIPSNYDGTFRFFFDLPVSQTDLTVWDGDFDRGKFDGTDLDTDDPDTPGIPFLPPWATPAVIFEGVAVGSLVPTPTTGNPPDDRTSAGNGIYNSKPPSVAYSVLFPDSRTFFNNNPSGNLEWERFRISTDPFDPSQMDYSTPTIVPPGTYELRTSGVDMQNLNALLLPFRLLCVADNGTPCQPLRPFLVGDMVFKDCSNRNGSQDNEGGKEPGLAGVTLELVDELGSLLATTTTDADGHYTFPAEAFPYTVRVAASNFEPGGPLEGYAATVAESKTETVVDDNVLTFDFGYCGTGSLGDYVWLDTNGDGFQDPDETGIPDVFIELLDGDGNVIDQTTTDADGKYKFGNLAPGDYTLRIDPLSRPAEVTASADLDGAETPDVTAVTLSPGQERTDVDFGYTVEGTASIGNRVWLDTDGDTAQDSDETGIPGVTVRLFDGDGDEVATTTTGVDGIYTFDSLRAGTYTVVVEPGTLPSGAVATFDADGTGTLHRATLTIEADDQRTDIDFGYRGSASLGDRVWLDLNGDTAQGIGENGINGVTVQLVDSFGNLVASTVTAGDGNYAFSHLLAGTYTVRLVAATLPPGSTPTYDLDGIGTPHTAVATVAGGTTRTDVDFGYRGNGSLGDRVWLDKNGNTSQDSGEPGLNGVTVQLLNSSSTVIASTTTAGDGNYSFTNLAAGTYTVRVVSGTLPAGTVPTYDLDGTGTAHNAAVTLAAGASRGDVDFGYRGNASIGDRVWSDTSGEGSQNAGEPGLNGVTVQLLDGSGNVVATTTTAGDGNYSFANLLPGTYSVRIVTASLPAGLTPTYDLDGTGTAHIATLTLGAGQSRTDVDFGYRPPATCTAGTFKDLFSTASFSNNDGSLSWSGSWVEYDVAGTGVSSGNVTVGTPYSGYLILRDNPDTGTQPSAARQANLAGFASATLQFAYHTRAGVDADDAVVIEVSKDGGASYTVLETLTGITGTTTGSRSYDITAYIAGNTRIRFRVSNAYGADDELFKVDWVRIDTGCTPPAPTGSIGDRLWKDLDGDGGQESGEAGLNGVTVELLDASGNVTATRTTSGDGNYSFTGLAAGTYKVRVVSSTLPAGLTPTYDLDGTGTAHTANLTLSAGQSRTDADFGYRTPPVSCTASTFKDTFTTASFSNNDGSASWSGAWVESDTAGSGVSSGNVTVGTPVSGYLILRDYPDTGTQPSAARQANLAGYTSATLTVDFHIRGVESDDVAVIEVSNNGGASYTVLETLTGYTGTYISSRTFDISAFRASNTRVRFRISSLYGGSDDFFKVDQVRIDAGCSPAPGSFTIGDRVWNDRDGDKAQDSGEPGIGGVTVKLYNSSNQLIATTTTNSSGSYSFSGLSTGTYTVKVSSSTLPSGVTQTYDKDGISTSNSATVSVTASRTDIDFGYKGSGSGGSC